MEHMAVHANRRMANMESFASELLEDDLELDQDIVLIECDLCSLLVSFADYASHVESHLAQINLMHLMTSEAEAAEAAEAAEDNEYELNLLMQDLMGRVEIGVDNIDRVARNVKLDSLETLECPICLEIQENVIIKRTPCNHDFCVSCITKWLSTHKTCPICIADVQMLSTASSTSSSSMNATTSSSARGSDDPDVYRSNIG